MFRAHKDSVDYYQLDENGFFGLYTHAEIKKWWVIRISRIRKRKSIELHQKDREPKKINVDYWLALVMLIGDWLDVVRLKGNLVKKNAIKVDHTLP